MVEMQVALHDLQWMDHVGCGSGCFCGLLGLWQLDCYKECCLPLSKSTRHISSTTFPSYTLEAFIVYWLDSKGEYILQLFSAIASQDETEVWLKLRTESKRLATQNRKNY